MQTPMRIAVHLILVATAHGHVQQSLSGGEFQASLVKNQPATAPVLANDGGLGSTMTLEQLNQKPAAAQAAENKVLQVRPAGESSPALKHRLWQPDYTLKPGSAQLHFFRAVMMWQEQPAEFRQKVEMWTADDQPQPSPAELKAALDQLRNVFDELHLMAISEDTGWDHRIRDLHGPALYAYLLPDVQNSRSLARLLDQQMRYQLSQGNIDGAIDSLRDGFRLAAFVGQGETLVQQLVGLAIESIVLNRVEELIQLPNAPNLYWALATMPRPLINLNDSIQFELGAIDRVLPVLRQAENENGSDEYWNTAWAQALRDWQTLGGDENSRLALALSGYASNAAAKERLIAAGMNAAEVEAMPMLRAVLMDTSREIRRIADDLAKANYLPGTLGDNVARQATQDFEKWLNENRFKSGAAAIVDLLFPAVQAAKSAGIRAEYLVNRLMTIEALRMHAAAHDGQLPQTLDELKPVPALPNPFTGQAFNYQVAADGDAQLVTLTADVPPQHEIFKSIRVRFTK